MTTISEPTEKLTEALVRTINLTIPIDAQGTTRPYFFQTIYPDWVTMYKTATVERRAEDRWVATLWANELGLNGEEIAATTGLSPVRVYQLIANGRIAVRKRLGVPEFRKMSRSRPKSNDINLSVRINRALADQIKAYAKKNNTTAPKVVRELLAQGTAMFESNGIRTEAPAPAPKHLSREDARAPMDCQGPNHIGDRVMKRLVPVLIDGYLKRYCLPCLTAGGWSRPDLRV